jgi:hypothetical protein
MFDELGTQDAKYQREAIEKKSTNTCRNIVSGLLANLQIGMRIARVAGPNPKTVAVYHSVRERLAAGLS